MGLGDVPDQGEAQARPGHALRFRRRAPEVTFEDLRLLTRRDCAELLTDNGVTYRAEYLAPTPPRSILRRMAMNLLHFYKRQGDAFRRARTARVLEMLRSGAIAGDTR